MEIKVHKERRYLHKKLKHELEAIMETIEILNDEKLIERDFYEFKSVNQYSEKF